jgi:hypothetical protein
MKNQIIYIDFDTGVLTDSEGATLMSAPTLQMGAAPVWELHFRSFAEQRNPDMSDATAFRAAIDTDLLSSTIPMVRSLDIDSSGASSGVLLVPIDTNTETFIQKVDGKDTVNAYFEIYGLDSDDKVIYDYRISVRCRGTVDYQGGEPIPVVEGGVTLADVYALLRAGYEVSFSADGTSWHDTQTTSDVYYRTRYPEGQWSEAILLGRGEDGADGTTPQLSIGTVTTLSAGSQASGSIVGPASALLLNLGIPSGLTGPSGSQGPSGITPAFTSVTATTLLPDAQATASITGEGANLSLSLGIPRGVAGQDGDDGTNGVGFSLVGAYDSETTYNPVTAGGTYEVVLYDGSSYAYIASAASAGHTPPTSEMSDSYWQIIAKRGDAAGTITVDASNVIGLGTFIDNEVSQDYYNKTYIDGQLSTKLTTPSGGSNGQVLAKTSDGYNWTSNVQTASKLFSAANIGNAPFDGSSSISLNDIGAAAKEHTHEISGVVGLEESLSGINEDIDALSGALEMKMYVVQTTPEASEATVDKVFFSLSDNHLYRGVAVGNANQLSADFRTIMHEGQYLGDGIYAYDDQSGSGDSREWYMDDIDSNHWVLQFVTNFPWTGQSGGSTGWVCSYDDYSGMGDSFFAEASSGSNPYDSGLQWRDYSQLYSEPINGTGVHINVTYSLSAII